MKTKIDTADNFVIRAAKTVWNGVVGFVKRVFAGVLDSIFSAIQHIAIAIVAPSAKTIAKAVMHTARYVILLSLILNPAGLIAAPVAWALEVAITTIAIFVYLYAYLLVLRILAGVEEMVSFVVTTASLRARVQEWAVA